jgi:hypothetical protein
VEPKLTIRELVGGAICVASFLGAVYCMVQHGIACTELPQLNVATNNVVPYSCKGQTAFITPLQERLIHRYSIVLMLLASGGYVLARGRR